MRGSFRTDGNSKFRGISSLIMACMPSETKISSFVLSLNSRKAEGNIVLRGNSNPNPLNLIEAYVIIGAVVKLGGSSRLVGRDTHGVFQ